MQAELSYDPYEKLWYLRYRDGSDGEWLYAHGETVSEAYTELVKLMWETFT